MTEAEFADRIDCNWPYHDIPQSRELIETAVGISPNAAFLALGELCHLPASAAVEPATLVALVDFWLSEFDHPMAPMTAECAISMIERRRLPVSEILVRMDSVSGYPGLLAALSILYFSCDDVEGRADARLNEIRAAWENLA
ncbi:hypothetical protein EOD10_07445 [Mesorhizobium sp. M7A.T.Ca.TU.009.01.3.2]|uniref:hypothetical protein n=1 Tax=Mesorhizobium sp. M7A.F.Ca.MR.245.00.0.0 TaxID=2496778 RepID=UPI000FCA7CB7|nr:hypothetical protein [Mesorhizobium sp. M7A.F.Ca.MR.245.00.0.0]RUU20295.1 hypothetical protein EOD10_07445 [Mesorhizobium sp. M7A.T.Ca.TU.009.01.3.2]RUV12177.1 hypothetical protein EOD00_07745 [Mesorhizobium sp. M7A.T.Ca.TU.009.01.3.1]RUV19154.1 hypothetical protein EOB80_20315 [Mesorhizobium sp. M7A.F.Ca.MR.245.00.0.0]RUV49579.1 hypothetical protein EOB77_18985 [Mesorhizobium sp. M7A.F.Ca.MR.228.00.0.0]